MLLLALGAVLLISYFLEFEPLKERAEGYLDKGLKTTLASYVVIRGLNASISVIKGSELFLSPAGMGFSIAMGEVLDPLDDITERVSALLLVSFLSLGVQKLILELLSSYLLMLSGVLTMALGVLVLVRGLVMVFFLKLLLVLLILRFFFPVVVLANDLVYEKFFRYRIETVSSQLNKVKSDIYSVVSSLSSVEEFKKNISVLKDRIDSAFEQLMHLALYFTLQTLILPLLNLWLTVRLSLGILRLKV